MALLFRVLEVENCILALGAVFALFARSIKALTSFMQIHTKQYGRSMELS